jgi:hypothetical protein
MNSPSAFVHQLCTRISRNAGITVILRGQKAQRERARVLHEVGLQALGWLFLLVSCAVFWVASTHSKTAGTCLLAFIATLGGLLGWALCGYELCLAWVRHSWIPRVRFGRAAS